MSSMVLADAVLRGTEPERRLVCEWHKSGTFGPRESYTVTLIEEGPDQIWSTTVREHFGVRAKALRASARRVEAYWADEDDKLNRQRSQRA